MATLARDDLVDMLHPRISLAYERCPINFLKQHPSLKATLLADCNQDLETAKALLERALHASERCQAAAFYIQAVVTGRTTFLTTNLIGYGESLLNSIGCSWLIGRTSTCAISIKHESISRCHAVLGYHSDEGYYLTDLGSRNGTLVNHHKLPPNDRRILHDGDLIQLGKVKVEFFLASIDHRHAIFCENTSF